MTDVYLCEETEKRAYPSCAWGHWDNIYLSQLLALGIYLSGLTIRHAAPEHFVSILFIRALRGQMFSGRNQQKALTTLLYADVNLDPSLEWVWKMR